MGRETLVVQLVGQGVQAGEMKLEHKGGVGARGPQGDSEELRPDLQDF